MNMEDILTQVNTLMVRGGIAQHRADRLLMEGKRSEASTLATFARAARSRARFLMTQLG